MIKRAVKGQDYRIRVYAKDVTVPLSPVNYNLTALPGLEIWVYTTDPLNIKKFNKGTLKAGYDGTLIRDDDYNYHINFIGDINKTLPDGQVKIDFYVGTSDSELTIFKNMESIDIPLFLVSKPISKWQ